MTKNEFMLHVALKLIEVQPHLHMTAVADMTRELTDNLFQEEKCEAVKAVDTGYDNAPMEDVYKALDAMDVAEAEERRKIWPTAQKCGYAVRLRHALKNYEIQTVGDLVLHGRRKIANMYNVGGSTVSKLDDILKEKYGICIW